MNSSGKNVTIAKRVVVGFIVVTAGTAVVAGAGAVGVAVTGRAAERITQADATLGTVADARSASLEVRRFEKDFMLNAGDAATQDKYVEEWHTGLEKLKKSVADLVLHSDAGEERDALSQARAAIDRYASGFERVVQAAHGNGKLTPGELNQLIAPVKGEIRTVIDALDRIGAARVKQVDEQGATAARTQSTTTGTLYSVFAAIVVAAVLASWMVVRSIGGAVRSLIEEAGRLSSSVRRGELSVRSKPEAVNVEFRQVVEGMNETMDAYAKPIRMASVNMERISRGDIPEQIADAYEGDFEEMKKSVNRCIGAVAAVVEDGKALAQAAVEGKLSARAEASRHHGDFRKIVEGFNGTLDAVTKPMAEATAALECLAQRDLRARVKGSYQGDHAKIAEALNATASALHDALAQVAQTVEQVSSASSQIASSSQAVASGASEQASSLEETGSSLESMASMTKQAADNAQQASALAAGAKTAATEGSSAMQEMSAAMAKIKASAEGTSQIIKDINEIAFQTNLLALNAAVEAARAGEAGRGFAVVAEEVRSLALRAKEAATKTEELIRQSVKEAAGGEVTAKRVDGKLSEIVTSVSKVTDIVVEISAASKEQSAGIDQISKAMGQMNTVTQQNAASSEESSSAAAELSSQAEEFAAMVGTFQLDGLVKRKVVAPKALPAPARKPAGVRKNGRNELALRPAEIIPFDDSSLKEF